MNKKKYEYRMSIDFELYEKIKAMAVKEKRSFNNMVTVILDGSISCIDDV